MPETLTKVIQKVITHVPTGKEWRIKPEKFTKETENENNSWLNSCPFYSFIRFQAEFHDTIVLIPRSILNDCVFSINVFETRKEV
jgi:hypothetical protein